MQVALLADTHYGCRNDNPFWYDYQKKFIDQVFLPYLKEHEIHYVIHLGDLVERRKFINFKSATRLRQDFLEPLFKAEVNCSFICGNHDAFYKSSLSINALRELQVSDSFMRDECYPFEIIDSPKLYGYEGQNKILLVPWICSGNRDEILNSIEKENARYCIGHFDFKGYEETKGRLSKHGEDYSQFAKFDQVFSGHYHIRSHNHNINYIGSAFEFTWDDLDSPRGFAVLETTTGEVSYVENPFHMFTMLDYDEENLPDLARVENSYVKVNVKNRGSEVKFRNFESKIYEAGAIAVTFIEKPLQTPLSTECIQTMDTKEAFVQEIKALELPNHGRVMEDFDVLYAEAMLQ
jgi:predicted phosphodiesterase